MSRLETSARLVPLVALLKYEKFRHLAEWPFRASGFRLVVNLAQLVESAKKKDSSHT
jgi:hypothetical protein